MRSSLLPISALFGLLLATGCPSEAPSTGDPTPDWGFVSATLAANCAPCHTSDPGYPSADPMMELGDADAAYDVLVDHPAAETGGALDRVDPGDSENSYIIHKLRGTHSEVGGSGERMPQGGPYLDDATIDAIAGWIDAGASEEVTSGDDDDATGDDDDATGDDDDSAGDDDDSATSPTFSDVYSTIISQECGCHSGSSHSTGFFFDGSAATGYGNLVGVDSFENPGMNRIEPGDPDDSYLVNKIQGTAGAVGGSNPSQMPLGGPFLSQTQIDLVRAWVAGGAVE